MPSASVSWCSAEPEFVDPLQLLPLAVLPQPPVRPPAAGSIAQRTRQPQIVFPVHMARVVVDRSGIEFREIGPWFEMAASQSGQRVHLRSWLRCGGTPPASSGREAASGWGRGSQSLQKRLFTPCVARLAILIGAASHRAPRPDLQRTTTLSTDFSDEK